MRPQRGKQQLLDSATRLFATQGYFSTTIEQITDDAGVSKGLVYNYFASKEDLLVGLIEATTVRMEAVARTFDPDESLHDALPKFLASFFSYLKSEKQFLTLQLQLMLTPELKPVVHKAQQARADLLLKCLTDWFRRAGVRKPKSKARLFLAMLDGIALHYLCIYEKYPLDTLTPELLQTARNICISKD